MTTRSERDREVSEACRNSTSRAERDQIVADYRVESAQAERAKLLAIVADALKPADGADDVWRRVTDAEVLDYARAVVAELVAQDSKG